MKTWAIFVTLFIAGSACAEQPVAVPDRVVSNFAVASTPVQRAVGRLAASQGLCVGTELFRKNLTNEDLAHPKPSAEPRPNVSLDAKPRTIRAALDDMIAQVPKYSYQIHGEWINVGRQSDMEDPDNPLNRHIPGSITISTDTIKHGGAPEVAQWFKKMNIIVAYRGSLSALRQSIPVESQTVTLKDPTLREYLNCANELRGKTTWTIVLEPRVGDTGWVMWESFGVLAK